MSRDKERFSIRRQIAAAEDTRHEADIVIEDQFFLGRCNWQETHDWLHQLGTQQVNWQKVRNGR